MSSFWSLSFETGFWTDEIGMHFSLFQLPINASMGALRIRLLQYNSQEFIPRILTFELVISGVLMRSVVCS